VLLVQQIVETEEEEEGTQLAGQVMLEEMAVLA
jgi:hypothetical protein